MQGATKETSVYTATEARTRFADIIDAAYHGERVVVKKHNRQVAIVSMSFIEHVDKLLEIEAHLESEAAKAALKEFQSVGGKTMEEMEQELDMD